MVDAIRLPGSIPFRYDPVVLQKTLGQQETDHEHGHVSRRQPS